MHRTEKEISVVDVINVHLIGIRPAYRPRLNDGEPVSAILKARRAFHDHGTSDAEPVLTAKMCPKTIVWNATATLVLAPVCLPCRFVFLFCVLVFLFRALVCLLRFLVLLLVL